MATSEDTTTPLLSSPPGTLPPCFLFRSSLLALSQPREVAEDNRARGEHSMSCQGVWQRTRFGNKRAGGETHSVKCYVERLDSLSGLDGDTTETFERLNNSALSLLLCFMFPAEQGTPGTIRKSIFTGELLNSFGSSEGSFFSNAPLPGPLGHRHSANGSLLSPLSCAVSRQRLLTGERQAMSLKGYFSQQFRAGSIGRKELNFQRL